MYVSKTTFTRIFASGQTGNKFNMFSKKCALRSEPQEIEPQMKNSLEFIGVPSI